MARLLLATALALSVSQANTQPFAGTWTADFKGTTHVRLELVTVGGALSGKISLGDLELDEKGELKTVQSAPSTLTPIANVSVKNSVLSFTRKDGEDTDRFEMRITGPGTADLHLVLTEADLKELAEDGIPAPKPIKLKKQ